MRRPTVAWSTPSWRAALRSVPSRLEGLGPAYLRHVEETLRDAQALSLGLPAEHRPTSLDAQLTVRLEAVMAARARAVALPQPAQTLTGRRLEVDAGASALLPRTPCTLTELQPALTQGWCMVRRSLPDRPDTALLRYQDKGFVEAVMTSPAQIASWNMLTEPQAVQTYARYVFVLAAETRVQPATWLQLGQPLGDRQ